MSPAPHSVASQLEALKSEPDPSEYDLSVLRLLNERYTTWDDLIRLSPSSSGGAASSSSGSKAGQEGEPKKDEGEGWDLDDDLDLGDDVEMDGPGGEVAGDGGLTMLEAEIIKWKDLQRSSSESVRLG
jgi:hypothetical protein